MEDDGIEENINRADPVGMAGKSRQYTILYTYSVQAQLSVYSDWISCMYLPQFPRLPFCVFIYLKCMVLNI